MKKDGAYIWKIDIDGQEHVVRCIPQKTLFDVYVDGELSSKVPRQMKHCDEDSEYDIRIGGKRCKFVVYDGEPDVAVDGILQGVEEEMRRKELRNKLLKFFGGIFVTLVSSFAVFLWYVFKVAGEPIFGGYVSLVFILIFVGAGIWLVVSSLKRKKEYGI